MYAVSYCCCTNIYKIRSFRLGPPETDETDPGLISLLELSGVCSVLVSFVALMKINLCHTLKFHKYNLSWLSLKSQTSCVKKKNHSVFLRKAGG